MRILCLSESITLTTQQEGVVGNESLVNTEPVWTPLGVRRVPCLTGNALRHRMVRSPGADWLIAELGLHGELTRDQLVLLHHGGARREKGQRPSLARIADMQRLVPLLGVMGCCLPEAIVSGDLIGHQALLLCKENAGRIEHLLRGWDVDGLDDLPPASRFVRSWQYVRGKLSDSQAATAADSEDAEAETMMPFSGTAVMAGAVWLHGFDLRDDSPHRAGCVLNSLSLWDGTIGGQSSRGHGQLRTRVHVDGDVEELIDCYRDYVRQHRDEAREFLLSC